MNNFRDSYGQTWYQVTALPIDDNLSELSSLLYQQRIEHRISENNGEQIVWVKDTALIPQLQTFIQQWKNGEISIVRAENAQADESSNENSSENISSEELDESSDSTFQPSQHSSPRSPSKSSSQYSTFLTGDASLITQIKNAPITFVMLVLCMLGTLIVWANLSFFDYSVFTFIDISGIRAAINTGIDAEIFFPYQQPWRFITPIFLHFGIMHILGNALFLWYFGMRLEKVFGGYLYLFFIVVVGVMSNIAQYVWEMNGNFGGFSGVNYGFVGYILIRQQMNPDQRLNVPSGLIWFPIVTMVLGMFGLVDILVGSSVANTAHATGFILGLTWAFISQSSALKS